MSWKPWVLFALAAGCGGAAATGPELKTQVAEERWFVSPARCSQGPFEIPAAAQGARWGEGVELVAASPRRIRLTAVVDVDGVEVARTTLTVNARSGGGSDRPEPPDNQRCVAGAVELAHVLGGPGPGGGSAGGTVPTVIPGDDATPPATGPAPRLDPAPPRERVSTSEVVGFTWPSFGLDPPSLHAGAHIRVRFWSSVPNDLDGVAFGLIRTVARPNVGDAAWEAHLRARAEAERQRAAQPAPAGPPRHVEVVTVRAPDPGQLERERHDAAARLERERRNADERAERERRRLAYCEAHHGDTSCWGPGGFTVHADLERRALERRAYCAAHVEEARCWPAEEWSKRVERWRARVAVAEAARRAPPEPKGPPPAPLAESQPPTPSQHAEWRPGYWYWNGGDWSWIAGTWNVPDSDLAAQLTAQAPAPPPADVSEAPPAAPTPVAVWTTGYWAPSPAGWVWVKGSWQLPPSGRHLWRAARWQPRGRGVYLVPGAWVTVGSLPGNP